MFLPRCRSASIFLLVGLAAALHAPAVLGQSKAKAKENQVFQQLQKKFQSWDTNKDQALDKYELARAFRGPNAKPYDEMNPGPKTVSTSKDVISTAKRDTVTPVALASLPGPGLGANLVLADVLARQEPAKTVKT